MAVLGFLFALFDSFSKAVDTLLNKKIMRTRSAEEHTVLRLLFVIPILFIASLFNWRLDSACIGYILLYGVLEAVNIFCHQLAVKHSNAVHVEMIAKSKVLLAMIVSFVLVIDTLSLGGVIGIAVFVVGTVLTINFQTKGDDRTGAAGICFEIVSVIARTFKPFILKTCVQRELISNETMVFLSMVIALVLIYAVIRPRVELKTVPVKEYTVQAALVAAGMLLSGWAVIFANIVIVNAIESISVLFVMLISAVLYKKKYTALSVIGCVLSVAGIIISILL
ncbi:MAG: EamA family transporter [Clostridia bacterium]|nr:EamA family transporter [Clostridia bacterium]